MIIAFDLDDVICTRPKDSDNMGSDKYHQCVPVPEMVKIVNEAYDNGHVIKIYTARGMSVFAGDTNKIYSNLYVLTYNHLNDWGVKFHELVMGKLHYDVLIDDKAVNSLRIKSVNDIINFQEL